MADPKLVAYLRKYLPLHGRAALRAKLLEEGLADEEIDAALSLASKPPKKGPPTTVFVVLAGIAVAAVSAFMALDKPPPKPAASEEPPFDDVAAGAARAPATPPPAGSKAPFMGHYGYMLKLPDGYATQSQFKDRENSTEVVYLYPEKTDPTHLRNEGLYSQLGILRLEASPRRIPEGTVGFESLKAGIIATLSRRGDTYTTRDLTVSGLPAFVVSITQPFPLAQAFVLGRKVMYVITGGADDPLFSDTVQSLNEVSPHDRPGDSGDGDNGAIMP